MTTRLYTKWRRFYELRDVIMNGMVEKEGLNEIYRVVRIVELILYFFLIAHGVQKIFNQSRKIGVTCFNS